MSLFDLFKSVISPITSLIDSLHTSEDEKLRAKAGLLTIQATLTEQVLDYEARMAEAQQKVITAEAQGASVLQRNWRPILMLVFTFIVFNNYVLVPLFGLPPAEVPEQMWTLMQIGVGGYIVGRSAEKVIPAAVAAWKSREET